MVLQKSKKAKPSKKDIQDFLAGVKYLLGLEAFHNMRSGIMDESSVPAHVKKIRAGFNRVHDWLQNMEKGI